MNRHFAITIFVSATLLFAVQPVVARMILPVLGGAASVWIVCSLCFQALVLAGYGYAHVVGSRLSIRAQVVLQLALVTLAIVVQPIHVDEALLVSLSKHGYALGVLAVLLKTVGLPFFVLSTTSPLVQRWLASAGEKDPYYLYAASNAGSMLALLGYPFLVEPFLGLAAQGRALWFGYFAYAVLIAGCAFALLRRRPGVEGTPAVSEDTQAPHAVAPLPSPWLERVVWIGLAFAPSSLLLGATNYMTTDIASIPLLWVVPLALYLASFIIAFGKKSLVPESVLSRALALAVAVVAMSLAAEINGPAWLLILLHMTLLFVAAVVSHRALALRRPSAARLTEFYLLVSVGGVLGGIFNGLVAPAVFNDIYEYPLAIAAVCLARAALPVPAEAGRSSPARDAGLGLALAVGAVILLEVTSALHVAIKTSFLVVFGGATLLAFVWSKYPVRYAAAVGGILLAAMVVGPGDRDVSFKSRDFFGVLKVRTLEDQRFRVLVFGTTIHGFQHVDPAHAREPLANFYPTGPAGDLFGPVGATEPPRRLGVIGLGVGALTGYARPDDRWHYYEISPTIVDIAQKHFSFLSTLPPGATYDVEVGDARLLLREGPPAQFDVLVMDAFSSDSIPVHLMTREAFAIYTRAMQPDALLIAHISNRHVKLAPVVAALARDAGLRGIVRLDGHITAEDERNFKAASHWVAMSTSQAKLDAIAAKNKAWKSLDTAAPSPVWTDDFANLLATMHF